MIYNTRLEDIVYKEIIPIKHVSHDTSNFMKSYDIGRLSFPNSASTSLGQGGIPGRRSFARVTSVSSDKARDPFITPMPQPVTTRFASLTSDKLPSS